MRYALTVALFAAAFATAAHASPKTGFAFGQAGGNIRPFTVLIAIDGTVDVTGPVGAGRTKLTRVQLGTLNALAVTTRFGAMPPHTTCKGSLPDFATSFIRVGPRTVNVRGGCVPAYQRLWKALASAVRLSR